MAGSASFLKAIKEPFCKGVNLTRLLKKCPVYDVFILFFSTRLRDTSFDV